MTFAPLLRLHARLLSEMRDLRRKLRDEQALTAHLRGQLGLSNDYISELEWRCLVREKQLNVRLEQQLKPKLHPMPKPLTADQMTSRWERES